MCLQLSQTKTKEFEREIMQAESDDEGLNRTDIITWAEMMPQVSIDWTSGGYLGAGGGAFFAAMSPQMAGGDY
jgi:hypothetical protein